MADRPLTSIERLRENVAVRVQATSLREVARQVGMSPSGLEKFLSGGVPYACSRQKLQEWWVREGHKPRSDISTEGVEVALGALVRDLPPELRGPTMKKLVRALRGMYETQQAVCPPWLAELSERWVPERDWARAPDADDAPPTDAPPADESASPPGRPGRRKKG